MLAAIALVDAEGLAQLTMRRLGAALGVEGMALYHYFPKRHALLDAVVEHLAVTPATDPAAQMVASDDWADWLTRLAHGIRAMALAHPRVFPLMATHPPEAPWLRPPLRSLRWIDAFLAGLGDHHFPPDAAAAVYKMFSSFLLGHLLLEVSSLGLEQPGTTTPLTPGDADRQTADQARRADTALALAVMDGDAPTAGQVLGAEQGRSTAADHEPAVMAASPAPHPGTAPPEEAAAPEETTARAPALASAGLGEGRNDRVSAADLDAPLLTAEPGDALVDLAAHPHVAALVEELSADTAEQDFDRHLGQLLEGLAALRRP